MKVCTRLIALSLAANVALGALLLRPRTHDARQLTVPQPRPVDPARSSPPAAVPASPETQALAAPFAGEIKDVVAKMRAAGYAPALIRAIAEGYVREEFRFRYASIAKDIPFWDVNANPQALQVNPEYHALDLELRKAVRDLIGPHDMERSGTDLGRFYGDIPAAKVAQVEDILSKYWDLRDDVRGAADSSAQYTSLEKLRRAEIEAILTPEELTEFDLRTSITAAQLRNLSEAFAVTEQEFGALLKARKAYDELYTVGSLQSMAAQERTLASKNSELKLDEDIDASLSPERAEAYRTLGDIQYVPTRDMTDRLGLPASVASEVIKLRRESTKRRMAMLGVTVRTADDRDRAQRARDEDLATAQAGLRNLLGERGYEIYTQSRLGNWATTSNITVRN